MTRVLCILFVLCAGVVQAQEADPHPTLFRASMVAAMAAHGADLATTEYCIGSTACREMNPFLLRFHQPAAFGAAKMGIAAGQLWLVSKMHELWPRAALFVNIVTTATFSVIAAHNARVTR